jgi:hypothetical protein
MPDSDELREWIRNAEKQALIAGLHQHMQPGLSRAQELANLLWLMTNPSPAIRRRIDSGELVPEDMLNEIGELIEQAFAILEFYKSALE